MKEMKIYEPAMCCETGICGVGVDTELLRISTVVSNLRNNGVSVQRFNLTNFPQEFISNADINKLIMGDGVDSLPATVVDGQIVKTKKYPTNDEIIEMLQIPRDYLDGETSEQSEECKCGNECDYEGKCC